MKTLPKISNLLIRLICLICRTCNYNGKVTTYVLTFAAPLFVVINLCNYLQLLVKSQVTSKCKIKVFSVKYKLPVSGKIIFFFFFQILRNICNIFLGIFQIQVQKGKDMELCCRNHNTAQNDIAKTRNSFSGYSATICKLASIEE